MNMVKTTTIKPKKSGAKTTSAKTQVLPKAIRPNKWKVTSREWNLYHKHKSPELRKQLLNKYIPLVRNVASRMAMGFPRSVELSDLVNTGDQGS